MRRVRYQQIASKLLKTAVILNHPQLSSYIPETRWYSPEALHDMLEKYPVVYLKPDKGTGGGGIIRIRRINHYRFEYKDLSRSRVLPYSQLLRFVGRKLIPSQRYIIQKGISLACVGDRPFDIRVILQKPNGKWLVSGIAAKIAKPGKIVTNYCKGGQPYDVFKALYLATSKDHEKAKKIFIEIYYISKEIAKILNRRFSGLRELGIDVGVDKQYNIWVFEVNTHPNFQLFRRIGNQEMYHCIRKRHKQFVI